MSLFDGLLGGLFGGGAYGRYSDSMENAANSYNPYTHAGVDATNRLNQYSSSMMQNPNMMMDQLAQHFSMSPYQQGLTHQLQGSMNDNAANTGMLGSQAANLSLGKKLSDMTGQFENQYIDRGLNEFNQAMGQQNSLAGLGLGALNQKNRMLQEAGLGRVQGNQGMMGGLGAGLGFLGSKLGWL